jgi:hypothetical protein
VIVNDVIDLITLAEEQENIDEESHSKESESWKPSRLKKPNSLT